MRRFHTHLLTGSLAALLLGACSQDPDPGDAGPEPTLEVAGGLLARKPGPLAPGARPDVVNMMRRGIERERDPRDGGGRAWLERAPDDPPVRAAGQGRFTLVYEAGPLGVATEGVVYLQVSPFWGWSTPQIQAREAPGYTEVEAEPDDISLRAETLGTQLMGIRVTGRPMVEGERIKIHFGAGPAGANADWYAERDSRFWISVDGNGDGTRSTIEQSPGVDVLPGAPTRMRITAPTIVRPGETVPVVVAVLDGRGSAGLPVTGEVVFEDPGPGLEIPEKIVLEEEDRGRATFQAAAREPGTYRLRAEGPFGLVARGNPIVVTESGPRILWADLHGHSALSDGTGVVDDYFDYARNVANLDVVALTDHDHWGIKPLDGHPEKWQEIVEGTKRHHEPGRFVTILGYEWTSWLQGHRHVLYFEDEGEVFSSMDPAYETPQQLWKALKGRPALTFAHHSAGGPIGTNWQIPPDPHFEPVTEIVSIHGSSEAPDSPAVIYGAYAGNFVRDALDMGYRLGFVGSGDSHDGHPGLATLAAGRGLGGLAAILCEERTRECVLEALRARRVYATNGPRILLRTALGAHGMGSTIQLPAGTKSVTEELYLHVIAEEPLERIDVIRSGVVIDSLEVPELGEVELQRTLEDLAPGEYVYVRAVQGDNGAAWSSPIFVEASEPGAVKD